MRHNLVLDLLVGSMRNDLLRIQISFRAVGAPRNNFMRQRRPNARKTLQLVRSGAVDVDLIGMRVSRGRATRRSRMRRRALCSGNNNGYSRNEEPAKNLHTVDCTAA